MGGCTNCAGKTGCDSRKGTMMEVLSQHLHVLYPTHRWDQMDRAAAWLGMPSVDFEGLATELASSLDAFTWTQAGGEDTDDCDYLYVLAMGRPPPLLAIRDGLASLPADLAPQATLEATQAPALEDRYLRIAVSRLAPVAAVQEVVATLEAGEGAVVIHERPQAGVYSAPLLSRFQRIVSTLPAYGLVHLDFGELTTPPPGFHGGAFASQWGTEPATYQYLFFATPATTTRSVLIPR